MVKVTEDLDLMSRSLKKHCVELEDVTWEVSTIRVIEDPENLGQMFAMLYDAYIGSDWKYETMIFVRGDHTTDYGHFRSNDSEDIVKAHDEIVALIAEGKLVPIEDDHASSRVSPHILRAMIAETERSYMRSTLSPEPSREKR